MSNKEVEVKKTEELAEKEAPKTTKAETTKKAPAKKTTTTKKATTTTKKQTEAEKQKEIEALAEKKALELAEKKALELAEKKAEEIIAKRLKEIEEKEKEKETAEMFKKTQERIAELEKELEAQKSKPHVPEFHDSTPVEVRSLTDGRLVYNRLEGGAITWERFGAIQELTFKELRHLRNNHPKFLTEGYLYIESKEITEALRLERLLDRLDNYSNLENLLLLDYKSLEKAIKELPKGMKHSLGRIASKKVKSGELDSLNKTRLIQKETGYDIGLNINL